MKSMKVCSVNDIAPNSGRAALVDGQQVAIFRLSTAQGEEFFAVDNFCPFSKANVISRGIVGSLKGKKVVASPIYKQHFDLETGVCLEDESVSIKTWLVNLDGEKILIAIKQLALA
jgi:nitrite reductase (NADH) small subunit